MFNINFASILVFIEKNSMGIYGLQGVIAILVRGVMS